MRTGIFEKKYKLNIQPYKIAVISDFFDTKYYALMLKNYYEKQVNLKIEIENK